MSAVTDMLVLMPHPMMPSVAAALEGALPLLKAYEAPDPEAAISARAGEVEAIATSGGHARIDGATMARFPRLRLVASFGVGYDHIDTAWAAAHGVTVTHTPGVLDDEVADTTMGLILNTVRRFSAAERHLREGAWSRGSFPLSHSLRGRTLGILGLGRIGKAVATRARAFGLKVIYHGREPQEEVAYHYYPTLAGLARACDILVAITPGGSATRHIVDARVLDALGPRGVFINVSRGSVVDEAALIAALRERRILAAGLDVYETEPHVPQALLDLDNAVLLPHVGSASIHTREAMGQLVVDNLVSFADGKGPLTPVPETPWPPSGAGA